MNLACGSGALHGDPKVSAVVSGCRELLEYEVACRYNGQVHYASPDCDPGEWVKRNVNYS